MRFHSTLCGWFSPLSYSLRTTVISESSSALLNVERVIRSASIISTQSSASCDAVNVSK